MYDSNSEVLLRSTLQTDFSDTGTFKGMVVDIIPKDYSSYTESVTSLQFTTNGGTDWLLGLYGTSIACYEFSCLINAWTYGGELRLISIKNMDNSDKNAWYFAMKDITDYRRGDLKALSSAIYYTSGTSSLTSFFSYSSDRYGYATGTGASDWTGVNY